VFKPSKELRALVAHEEYIDDGSEMDDDE